MKLEKIQYFDAFGEEKWMDTWTDDIKELIKNHKNDKLYNTNNHGFDIAYFYMIDHLGHTTFYRMDLEKFEEYWWRKKEVKDEIQNLESIGEKAPGTYNIKKF